QDHRGKPSRHRIDARRQRGFVPLDPVCDSANGPLARVSPVTEPLSTESFSFPPGRRVLALCGGVGGAKLALGLSQLLPPEQLTIAVNTGDDFSHYGLPICPDLDT